MCSIIFVNDKSCYNLRYRSNLINRLSDSYRVDSFGLFDDLRYVLNKLLIIFFQPNTFFVSSNLKTNLVVLLCFWRPKIVIINGLGRFRKSKLLRLTLFFLFSIQNRNIQILVQNFADFRYFKRFSKKSSVIKWMPGSGGHKRKIGPNLGTVSVISRDTKFKSQISSILEFHQQFKKKMCFIFIGIVSIEDFHLPELYYVDKGYVSQDAILSYSNSLLIPEGYGEGIPHTLADAIVSNAKVYMTRKNFIGYGFYKFANCKEFLNGDKWVVLNSNNALKELLKSAVIEQQFIRSIELILGNK